MTARDQILNQIRTSLRRQPGPPAAPVPRPMLEITPCAERLATFFAAIEKLNGETYHAPSYDAAALRIAELTAGNTVVASKSPILARCKVASTPGVEVSDAEIGITTASFGLADTGTLVMMSTPDEPRLLSLLPPMHIAVVPEENILSGLDELLTLYPLPGMQTSAMVLITGPSRTADIEQILVQGVHGPGKIYVIVV